MNKPKIRIGAGWHCNDCKAQEENEMWDQNDLPHGKCPKCGENAVGVYIRGKRDHVVFVFTYKVVEKTIEWEDKPHETRKESVWTLDTAWDDGRGLDDHYNKIKTGKDCLVKLICTWSMYTGIYIAQIDGLKVSGFPFGFGLDEMLRKTHLSIQYLPDYTQIIRKITMFVQRYYLGLVKLEDDRENLSGVDAEATT